MPKRVVIVQEGEWGHLERESYDHWIQHIVDELGRVKEYGGFKVQVVATHNDVLEIFKNGHRPAVIIYVSRGMQQMAEEISAMYPQTRIMVFTRQIPEGKVIWIDKIWLGSKNLLVDLMSF